LTDKIINQQIICAGLHKIIEQSLVQQPMPAAGFGLSTGQNPQSPSEFLEFCGEVQGDIAQKVESVADEGLKGALECFFKGIGLPPSWSSSPVR
jgi:hypothetical protein